MKLAMLLLALTAALATAQAPSMRQLMLNLIHPASNEILLFVNRGSPAEADWAQVRRSALTLAESGTLLIKSGRAPQNSAEWNGDAEALAKVGTAVYRAAQAKDLNALAALTDSLDASCTNCHKQFRPNVFPRKTAGGEK